MNKDIYLEQLYNQLQKYDIASPIKHVTEYDYIISDMLENESIEDVIEKLGTAEELAKNIAEEFEYTEKDSNQFEEPILNNRRGYKMDDANGLLIKIINVVFAIFAAIFFISYIASVIGLLLSTALMGIISIPIMLLLFGAIISASILVFSIFMIILNFKNLLVNSLLGEGETTNA